MNGKRTTFNVVCVLSSGPCLYVASYGNDLRGVYRVLLTREVSEAARFALDVDVSRLIDYEMKCGYRAVTQQFYITDYCKLRREL